MNSQPDLKPILEDLAAGRIDADEAGRRIDALRGSGEAGEQPGAETPERGHDHPEPQPAQAEQQEPAQQQQSAQQHQTEWVTYDAPRESESRRRSGTSGVDRVSVRAIGRRVRVVGDASVATVAAEGPHVLRRNGSVLEVASDGDIGPNLDGFSLLRPPRSLDDLRALGLGKELFLRVNPSIVVDIEVTAGTLHTERVPYLGKVRVTAGAAELRDVAEAADVLVQAGQATVEGSIKTGRSRLQIESGQLTVRLHDDSNVTVRGESNLGRINWTGGHTGPVDEVVMGNGSARLDVSVVMGYAQVRVGSGAE